MLGNAVDGIDLPRRLRDAAEDLAVVELLPRLAPAERSRHLADEQDHRRGVLLRGVHADRGLRRAGPARDEADPGAARQLPVRLCRIRGALLVPAGDEPDRRVVQRVEHREVALAREAEREIGAVQLELVDEDPPARPHSDTSRRIVGALESRLVLVGGVEVADRAAPRPLGRQEHDADECGVLCRRGSREDGIVRALEPGLARAVRLRLAAFTVDGQLAVQDPADPGPWMHVPVRDASGREVDPVESGDPPGGDVDLHGDESVGRRAIEKLPDEPRPVLELVLDPVRSVVGRRGEREDQWKYWPPSMTIV